MGFLLALLCYHARCSCKVCQRIFGCDGVAAWCCLLVTVDSQHILLALVFVTVSWPSIPLFFNTKDEWSVQHLHFPFGMKCNQGMYSTCGAHFISFHMNGGRDLAMPPTDH